MVVLLVDAPERWPLSQWFQSWQLSTRYGLGWLSWASFWGWGLTLWNQRSPLRPGAAPTGEQGCVYTYGKASFVKLDDVAPWRHWSFDFFSREGCLSPCNSKNLRGEVENIAEKSDQIIIIHGFQGWLAGNFFVLSQVGITSEYCGEKLCKNWLDFRENCTERTSVSMFLLATWTGGWKDEWQVQRERPFACVLNGIFHKNLLRFD